MIKIFKCLPQQPLFLWVFVVALLLNLTLGAAAAENKQKLDILLLHLPVIPAPGVDDILTVARDSGIEGAKLALTDSQRTGEFIGLSYSLKVVSSDNADDLVAAASAWLKNNKNTSFIISILPSKVLKSVLKLPTAKDALIINAFDKNANLRQLCKPNLLHTIASRAMLYDSLMQYLLIKNWKKIFFISGTAPKDQLEANAIRASAKKYGVKFIHHKTWQDEADLRRTAGQEMLLFTKIDKPYDLIMVADGENDFGEYIFMNSSLPRPVVGTNGIVPVTWSKTIEQWGARQLRNRFYKKAKRHINAYDYSAWAAVRSVATAFERVRSNQVKKIRSFIVSDAFNLAAFKGRKLSFRAWSGQMRQPIYLVQPNAVVGVAPYEKFLHPKTDMDALGIDITQSQCR